MYIHSILAPGLGQAHRHLMPFQAAPPSPLVAFLALFVYSLSVVDALPVDPNATSTTGLFLPDNITMVAETVISIPMEISPQRDQALARLGSKAVPVGGAIQAALESSGDLLTPIGEFFQRFLDTVMGKQDRYHPVPAL